MRSQAKYGIHKVSHFNLHKLNNNDTFAVIIINFGTDTLGHQIRFDCQTFLDITQLLTINNNKWQKLNNNK